MAAAFSPVARALVDHFQRNFPLCPRPWAEIAHRLGVSETAVRKAVEELDSHHALSRIGPVFAHDRAGASTLAAMSVPEQDLERVARRVNQCDAVNHNYEREHAFNLWFVAAAPDHHQLQQVLTRIEQETGYPVMSLPMLRGFHIDLGFPVDWGAGLDGVALHDPVADAQVVSCDNGFSLSEDESARLKHQIQGGLPLVSRPYRHVASATALTEEEVLAAIALWQRQGLIKRFGLVVRHRALGYRANAMVVWDIPDDEVEVVARKMADMPFVTLCYQRPRRLPQWPYNLFCMIHGRSRDRVLASLDAMIEQHQLQRFQRAILFSKRAFKQCGARYFGHARPDETACDEQATAHPQKAAIGAP